MRELAPQRDHRAAMRTDMARHKPSVGPLDVKLGPGGLVVQGEGSEDVMSQDDQADFAPRTGKGARDRLT